MTAEPIDYKNTLNLPKTNFQMRANLAVKEPDILKYWDTINLYELQKQTFSKTPKKKASYTKG